MEAKVQHHENGVGGLPSQQQEAKRELKVNFNNETLPFCSEPNYLGVPLDRSLTYRRHHESLCKKANITCHTPEATCWLQVGCWSNNMAYSHPSPGSFDCRVLLGAALLIPASLTPPSTTPCELCVDACVLHQRTTFQSSQASNLLSFVTVEPHYL